MDIKITEREKIRIINSDDIFAIMRKVLLRENKIDREKEHFWIIGLGANSRLLFIELVTIGWLTSASVKPVETFRVAVQKNAVGAILVHNHPEERLLPGVSSTWGRRVMSTEITEREERFFTTEGTEITEKERERGLGFEKTSSSFFSYLCDLCALCGGNFSARAATKHPSPNKKTRAGKND